jgi:hypothetical protein
MKPYRSLPLILLFLQVGVFCSIGQGIRVASAYYGSPNGMSVDVTSRVQQFADYGEPFRVGKETLRIDPASTRRKTLVVIYDLNGHRISDSVEEGDVFYFRNWREIERKRPPSGVAIRITQARYGAQGRYSDVTDRVQALARRHQTFTVSNKTFGLDPYPGRKKWLEVTYLRGRTNRTQKYSQGSEVRLK